MVVPIRYQNFIPVIHSQINIEGALKHHDEDENEHIGILEQNDEDEMTVEWQNDVNWNKMMKLELEFHKE